MGIIKDFLDIARDIATASIDTTKSLKSKNYGSLSKRSLEGTLQFPVLVSTSLDMDTVQMISRALEKNYASFAQISMAMSPFMKLSSEREVSDYIRNFHQNSDVKLGLKDTIQSIVSIAHENCNVLSNEDENIYMISVIHEGTSSKLLNDNIRSLQDPMGDLNLDIVNKKVTPDFNYNLTGVSDRIRLKYNTVKEDVTPIYKHNPTRNDRGVAIGPEMDAKLATLPKEALGWTKVQKLNELMPTQLTINIKVLNKDEKTTVGDLEIIIGIKSTLHPIKTDEMIINTVNACKNNNKIFNFIRWTTGEISFFKDFLFNIAEIKGDVTSLSSGVSSWWSALKRRKALATIKNAFPMFSKTILPNATLVLSMEEVSYIKNNYGYDLMSPYFLNRIMSTYFLLGFVVVDNSTQVAHFMFDGQTSFQMYGFSSLKKEAADDQNFKQMLNIIRRV